MKPRRAIFPCAPERPISHRARACSNVVVGTYRHCGEQHLHRYLAEFDFRYNNRAALEIDDKERAKTAPRRIARANFN